MSAHEPAANLPFRWDLARPDQLGALLDGGAPPDLWFADELVVCAAKVLARCGDGRLVFVGRSGDSVFDLLSGVLEDTDWRDRLVRLPFSFTGDVAELTPDVALALVYAGRTFTNLYGLLRTWIAQEREPWNAARLKLRFVGITERHKTSPNTWRWQQSAPWTGELPARSVVNVSIGWRVWSYLGNSQTKLTRSFHPARWTQAEGDGPARDERTRTALAEAVALVRLGRTSETRRAIVRALDGEPSLSEPWLRKLVLQLR